MNEIKVEVMFTDGYQKRYTEAVAKAYHEGDAGCSRRLKTESSS